MEDVKPDVSEAIEAPAEETAEQVSQPEEQTSAPETEVEKTIPYTRFAEVNKKYKEMQRKLAEVEGSQKLSQVDPSDYEAWISNPLSQEVLIKVAKQELSDYARTTLEQYPNLHPAVKKAILSNVRGFVNENTSDVETAKLDLQEYIESIAEEAETTQAPLTPKTIKVATTNVSKTDVQGVRPAEIQKILDKPILSWTDKETEIVDSYAKSSK